MKAASAAVLRHPLVVGAIALTGGIIIASGAYYVIATRTPQAMYASPVLGSIQEVVTGTGSVEPAQNPDLAFESGGRVTRVNAAVGQTVYAGQLLASLDTATLAAQRDNANATLTAQQAKLAEMQAGARQVDIQVKQTAVDQANITLQNIYSNIAANLASAHDKAASGISANTDTLFNQPNTPSPTLSFSTSNNQAGVSAINARVAANNTLTNWSSSLQTLSGASSAQDLEAGITLGLSNLAVLQTYNTQVLNALNSAIATGNFTQSAISSAQVSVGSLRDTVNGLILTLQGIQQQLASQKLAVQSAQDALNQTLAGSTPQDLQAQQAAVQGAQATVAMYNAQISNAIIIAPFSGTVSSVHVKSGDVVSANTPAISLNPQSAEQVDVYLSEVDAAKVNVGNTAQVTLDAYGSAQPFAATVVSIDRSPTLQNNIPGYKATLQFAKSDPKITSGLTANVTITAAKKDNVLIIPKSAVLQNGTTSFVLVQNGTVTEQRTIQTGIESTDSVEVTSGLAVGDRFVINSK